MHVDPGQIEKLSEGLKEVLRLVSFDLSSKEIAPRLGISHHAVDQRIKRAMAILNTQTRKDAADSLAIAEGRPIRRLVYQSSDIAKHTLVHADDELSSCEEPERLQADVLHDSMSGRWEGAWDFRSLRGSNDWSVSRRLLAIFIIATTAVIAFGALLGTFQQISALSAG